MQNGVNGLTKTVLKNSLFSQKAQNFVHFGPYDLVQISPACDPNTYQIMFEETLDFQREHMYRQHRKVLLANLLQKLIFRSGILCYHH